MKQIFTLAFFLLAIIFKAGSQGVAINANGASPNSSAMLDVNSTTKGLLIPRMTTLQKAGIVSPADGLMVYDTDLKSFWFFKTGTGWTSMAPGGSTFTLPYDGSVNIAGTAFRVTNNNGPAVEGSSVNGSGIYGNSISGTGVNALSTDGIGVFANSINNSAVYAFSNNANPTIIGSNSNGLGVGIKGNSSLYHGVLGTSGGANTAGIRGEATGISGVGVFGTSSGTSGYGVFGNVTNGTGVYGFSTNGVGVKAYSTNLALEVTGNVKISGGNTNPADGAVLTSDASGNAVWQKVKVGFRASGVIASFVGLADNTFTRIQWEQEGYDYDNNYALHVGSNPGPGSSVFTAPVAGLYHFSAAVDGSSKDDDDIKWVYLAIKVNRAGVISTLYEGSGTYGMPFKNLFDVNAASDVKLNVGDKVYVEVALATAGNKGGNISGANVKAFFSGHLVFAD